MISSPFRPLPPLGPPAAAPRFAGRGLRLRNAGAVPGLALGLLPVPIALAQVVVPVPAGEVVTTGNPFLHWLWLALGLVAIWCFFYFSLFPRLLPSYGEDRSRSIFWTGFFLYAATWTHLVFYVWLFWSLPYLWIGWTAGITVVIFGFFFLLSFARRA